MRITKAVADTVTDHGPTRLGEWLAGGTARQEVDPGEPHQSRRMIDHIRVREIPVNGETGEVVTVSFHSLPVMIDGKDHPVADLLQTQAEPPCTRKEVRCDADRRIVATQSRHHRQQIVLVRAGLGMRFEAHERPAHQLHPVATRAAAVGGLGAHDASSLVIGCDTALVSPPESPATEPRLFRPRQRGSPNLTGQLGSASR